MLQEKILKAIKYFIYLLVVLVPLIYFPTGMFPFQIVKTVLLQSLIEIIFALWLALSIFYKEYRPKITPILGALVIFIVAVSISSIFGVDFKASLWSDEQRSLGLVALFHLVALFLVMASLRERINWETIWLLCFGTAVVVSLVGILQRFLAFPKGSNPWLYILYPHKTLDRIGSTFNNSAFMAGYLLFNLFIGFWLILSQISNFKPRSTSNARLRGRSQIFKDPKVWILGIGTVLIAIAILLSQTLGVMTGLLLGILILLIYFLIKREELRKLSTILLALILIFGATFWLTKGNDFWQKIPGVNRAARASFEDQSIRDRLIVWQLSLKAFREKPILGWGLENFRIAYNKYYDPRILTNSITGSQWDKPHNVILEYLATAGILGLLAYLSIFVTALYALFKTLRSPEDQLAQPFLLAMLGGYFVSNFFVFDTIGTYLMLFLAISFIDYRYQNSVGVQVKNINGLATLPAAYFKAALIALLLIVAIPVYYNYEIFDASRYEYWGVNYFLNRLTESSLVSFSNALNTPTPYANDIKRNFADTVRQAYEQSIQYPSLGDLQGKLVTYLKSNIDDHPLNFFNYISLADFENTFYKYNPDYLDEALKLSLKALELSPDRQQIYYVLAKTQLLKGNIPAAYETFKKVVSLNPNAGDPHFFFGLMAYGLGDTQRGAKEIAIAESLGRKPRNLNETVALANFIGDYDHNYKKAIELYKQALISADSSIEPSILLKLAVAYYFDEDYEASRSVFNELKNSIDLKSLQIYPDLQPVLKELKIEN